MWLLCPEYQVHELLGFHIAGHEVAKMHVGLYFRICHI